MEATDVTYNSTFFYPPNDDLSPLNYFEKFIDNSIIENLVDQIFILHKKQGSLSTHM
jgi:hypothetical protein